MRALAAFGVVFAHVGYLSQTIARHRYGAGVANLSIGVAVFFAISGFLLYRPFFNSEISAAPRPAATDFLRRRVLRIVPAYWLALTVLAIYPGLPLVHSNEWWRYYFFLQVYSPLFAIFGLTVAWSLCIEVTFYALLPLYAALTRLLSRRLTPLGRVRFQLVVIVTLGLGSFVLRIVDFHSVLGLTIAEYFDWFAVGMVMAVLSVARRAGIWSPRPVEYLASRPVLCWGAAAAVYLLLAALLTSAPLHNNYSDLQRLIQHALSAPFALLVLWPAVFDGDRLGWPRRVLAWRWLAWLGLISYGIYLWHAPLAGVFLAHGVSSWWPMLFGTIAVTIVCAAGSYYVVERPILRFKNRPSRGRRVVRAAEPASDAAAPGAANTPRTFAS
jgi:peptidoglycan/LPS O-acetylase OafA/YrhL